MTDPDVLDPHHPDVITQSLVMSRALQIYKEREAKYQGSWKELGWRDSLMQIRLKARRLLTLDRREVAQDPEEYIDDALDLINYVCFFIRNVEGRREGSKEL